jgi:uncharacterized protein (DUF305 family)
MMTAMDKMHAEMNRMEVTGDLDRDFMAMMVPHHQSAVEMAKVYLEKGRDPELRKLSEEVIRSQEQEMRYMRSRLPEAGTAKPHSGH